MTKSTTHRKKSAERSTFESVWFGNLPTEWEVKRFKYLFNDVSVKNRPEETLLSVTQSQGVVPRDWVETRMVMPSGNLHTFKYIKEGDFAISLRSFEGGLEYCYHDGIISPAYTVLKNSSQDSIASFYRYLFKSTAFISELQTSTVGIREGRNISYSELSNSLMPIPPVEVQKSIANFLDDKTEKIERAIAIKEKQIELLKERKQILIQNTVTRGLNLDAPMKDSGVDWIGEIPAHWKVKKVKWLARIRSGDGIANTELISKGTYEAFGGNGLMGFTNKWNVEGKNIIIGRVGAHCGNVRLISERKWISDNALILTSSINNHYLAKSLEAANLNQLNESNAQPLITGTKVLNTSIAVPDNNEVVDILKYITLNSQMIETAKEITKKQIQRLKEYKASLINSAVTGKIKVPT